MKPYSALRLATATIVCASFGALSAHAQSGQTSNQTSASVSASVAADAKPVTVPVPMGPHLNEGPSTVVTGTIAGITDKGPAAATENLAGDFKTQPKPPTASTKKVKGAKVKAKGVAQVLTATRPAPSVKAPQTQAPPPAPAQAPTQANASVDAKVEAN